MKKLFISCPMAGRSEENILKTMEMLHKIAEIMMDEELEVIPTYLDETAPDSVCNNAVWFLGRSIELMAEADCFTCINLAFERTKYHGCDIERKVATHYGLKVLSVDLMSFPSVAQDLYEEISLRGGIL